MTDNNIPKDYDHEREGEWQDNWQKKGLYKFIGDGNRPSYIIDTPPPYPTGSIHMGHVLNWLYMDLIARFKRMNGYDVLFPQGWDCHGLPTEVKVEETHQIKKSDVDREEFRRMCIDLTRVNIDMMKTQMQSLGFSQDWSREFVTMTPEYKRKTQLSFLEMYNKGLIYQAVHPVNWCPRCETAIAFAEVEYHENETYLNYLEFPEVNGMGKVSIATTRPELLSACVAVTVHPDDERYQGMAGKYLEVPIYNRKVKLITDSDVDPEFGTGAVMICTFGDKTDVSWVKRYELDIIEAIDEKGIMKEIAGEYAGCTINECKEKIIADLKTSELLVKQEKLGQNVGLCWRCKTPIEILIKKQWFVAVNQLTDLIKDTANDMTWKPKHMKTRLDNWTDSMDWDWCISRQRIFATPIPVWYCKECGEIHLSNASDLPVDPSQDQPRNACTCGCNDFIGEVDVLDTWMDSSITPMVIAGWPSMDYLDLYPANLRQQGHDIIRTWAFYTILRCKILTGLKPFQEVVVNGMVFGDDGHKMSKSRGNVIAPEEVISKYGADALRLWAANSVPGSDVPFVWKDVTHGYKFLRKYWNAFRFINIHIKDYHMGKNEEMILQDLNPLDQWILSKLNSLVKDVTNAMETYNFADARVKIQSFIWHDFCDEYIEAVKYRLYNNSDTSSQETVKYTLRQVIITSLKLLSPLTPHFTEAVYQYLNNEISSIHETNWPVVNENLISEEVEEYGKLGVKVIGDIRRFKSAMGMPLNTMLKQVIIYTHSEVLHHQLNHLYNDIKGTIRIDDLQVEIGQPNIMEKVVEIIPRKDKIGPYFRGNAPKILNYLESHDPQIIVDTLNKDGEILIDDLKLTSDYIKTRKEIISSTGEKVDILHFDDIDVVIEIIS
ncbi:MAG: valine--tRNA ligase [Methanobacterium sp.]